MRMNEVDFGASLPVDGYGPGFFRLGGQVYRGGVLIGPPGVLPWSGFAEVAPLVALAPRIDVLLVGTGAAITMLPGTLRQSLEIGRAHV